MAQWPRKDILWHMEGIYMPRPNSWSNKPLYFKKKTRCIRPTTSLSLRDNNGWSLSAIHFSAHHNVSISLAPIRGSQRTKGAPLVYILMHHGLCPACRTPYEALLLIAHPFQPDSKFHPLKHFLKIQCILIQFIKRHLFTVGLSSLIHWAFLSLPPLIPIPMLPNYYQVLELLTNWIKASAFSIGR